MTGFLLLATVYLATMIVAVPIASRLGLGSVLGYLLAGVVIGPVLGLAGSEMSDLQHFAEFGVVMMLFLIGLELEPRALWAMRDKLLGLGGLQVVLSTAAIAGLLLLGGQHWRVALALGLVFSLSSTAIVLQTLTEKALMQTPGGRAGFAVLLTQDIAVIPILAVMPLLALPGARALARADHDQPAALNVMQSLPGWGAALATVGAIVLVVLAGRYLVQPLFRFVHAARLREIDTALALLIVVGIASLMSIVGLSPALGTFLAGVVLAGSEFRHELEAQVQPFKGLLLGLFFITVGAGIDMGVLARDWAMIIGWTILLIAVKAGVLFGLSRLFRLHGEDRWLFTLGLAQAGEFGFVLISFAISQRILTTSQAQTALLVITMSMLATPALFILHRLIADRLRGPADPRPAPDAIDDQQPIIIAGIGRFGQVVNRMVTMSGFRTVVLDHDLRTIQLLRKFGFKAYFGDPSRAEILAAAGLAHARILVVCLDDPAAAIRLVTYARKTRPDLHIIARARDRFHVYELYAAGANDIVREMFDSSLRAARYVLERAGLSDFEAAEAEKIFYKLDRAALRELAEVWDPNIRPEDNPAYVARTKELNAALEQALMARFDAPADALSASGHLHEGVDRVRDVG